MRVVNRRRELLPEMRVAGEHGKSMYLSLDKLIIKDRLECQQKFVALPRLATKSVLHSQSILFC